MDHASGGAVAGPELLVSTPARDRQLVRAAALGDELAWQSLVDTHGQLVWASLLENGLGRDEAVAAYELVWVRLAQCLAGLNGEPVTSWLNRIAVAESEHAQARAGRNSAFVAWQRDRRRVARAGCG